MKFIPCPALSSNLARSSPSRRCASLRAAPPRRRSFSLPSARPANPNRTAPWPTRLQTPRPSLPGEPRDSPTTDTQTLRATLSHPGKHEATMGQCTDGGTRRLHPDTGGIMQKGDVNLPVPEADTGTLGPSPFSVWHEGLRVAGK